MSPTDEDLQWLADVLGGPSGGGEEPYLGRVASDGGSIGFLVPTRPPKVSAAALARFNDGQGVAERTRAVAATWVGRFGMLTRAPGLQLRLPRYRLVDHLASALGEPELYCAITVGGRRRNRKPVLQLMTAEGDTVGFAKVGWSPTTAELVTNEADILTSVEPRVPFHLDIPHVVHFETWNDTVVVVTSHVRGYLRSRPPVSPTQLVLDIAALAPQPRAAVAQTSMVAHWQQIASDSALEDSGLTSVLESVLAEVVRRHGSAEVELGLWHGDLTPWNISCGGRTSIWDWEFAAPGRPIGFDALHQHFEQYRRAKSGGNRAGIEAVIGSGETVISKLGLGYDPARRRALVDLYLCQLLVREIQLANQRWTGSEIAQLGPVLSETLTRRLGIGQWSRP